MVGSGNDEDEVLRVELEVEEVGSDEGEGKEGVTVLTPWSLCSLRPFFFLLSLSLESSRLRLWPRLEDDELLLLSSLLELEELEEDRCFRFLCFLCLLGRFSFLLFDSILGVPTPFSFNFPTPDIEIQTQIQQRNERWATLSPQPTSKAVESHRPKCRLSSLTSFPGFLQGLPLCL